MVVWGPALVVSYNVHAGVKAIDERFFQGHCEIDTPRLWFPKRGPE